MVFETQPIFIDSGLFKALIDLKDDFHLEGTAIWSKLEKDNSKLVTTNFVLDESFTLIRSRRGLKLALEFRDFLIRSYQVLEVTRVTIEDEAGVWAWFEQDWSHLSYTDCTSFAVMKRLGIKRAATFDKHFRQAGFQIEK